VTRSSIRKRVTKETSVEVELDLDGSGTTDCSTGIPFYDHMLDQLGRHGGFDLTVKATGDLDIDTHHTVEDVAIALDISGRPYLVYEVDPGRERIGTFDPQLMEEFWRAFVHGADVTLHVTSRSGRIAHHIIEATFKGLARCLRDAVRVEAPAEGVPSTKGAL